MKILILGFLLISSLSYASDHSEILYYRGRSLGNNLQSQLQETRKILTKVETELNRAGVQYTIRNLKDNLGNTYPVIRLSTSGNSALNKEALRVSHLMGGIPLIFSPYDLGRSKANAFYDPKGTMIGVSYRFILGVVDDSSYLHELYHANTYAQVVQGRDMQWAGVKRLLKGSAMSASNSSYYFRFASLDELPATALSLQLDTFQILEMRRLMSAAEFNKSRGEGEDLLGNILLSANAGEALARQVQDIATKALASQYSVKSELLAIGSLKRTIHSVIFSLSSHDRVFSAGRGTNIEIPDGVEFKMYSVGPISDASLKRRLNQIIVKARSAQEAFFRARKCIYVLIEYPDVTKTDYSCLENEAPKAYQIF